MSYLLPQPYKCLKCGHEIEYSPYNHHPAPSTESFIACPKCWEKFLHENIGELKCTISFVDKSEYDKEMLKVKW